MHHGSKSAKRTVFYGNLSTMNHLDKGVLSKKEKELKTKVSTTRNLDLTDSNATTCNGGITYLGAGRPGSYRDQNGVKRFVGKKEELKSTQRLAVHGFSVHITKSHGCVGVVLLLPKPTKPQAS